MQDKLSIRALKGAPLSILVYMLSRKNQTVGHALLCRETGYSDKTVSAALDLLTDNQIICRVGHSGWQLMAGAQQLPLYWGETVLPSPGSDSRKNSDCLPGFENFSGQVLETGNIPTSAVGNSALEKRVAALESEILRLKAAVFTEKLPEVVEIPAVIGEIPDEEYSSSSVSTLNKDICKEEEQTSAKSEKIREVIADYERRYADVVRAKKNGDLTALEMDCPGCSDMLELTSELKEKIIARTCDEEVLTFLLPRVSSAEKALEWCRYDARTAKLKLMQHLGIGGPVQRRILDNPLITIWDIDWHFWNWKQHESENAKITFGTILSRIENKWNRMETDDFYCKQWAYLG